MDIKLTELQERYGLRLEPSGSDELEGYFWLKTPEDFGLTLSKDGHEIHRLAHAYLMGAIDWARKDHPAELEVVA